MIVTNFHIPTPDTNKYIVNKTFKFKNKQYKIYTIEKTWGDIPVFLAYGLAINDDGVRQRFLIKCIANIYSKSEEDTWEVSINTIDN